MTDRGTPAGPSSHPRRDRRVQRRKTRAARLSSGDEAPRVSVGHRVFFHERGEALFGPGVFDLLVGVDEEGSLREAARSLGMAYSKAWRVLGQAEEHLGLELLRRRAGGSAGGGSKLTEDGRRLVERFRAFIDEADADLARLYLKHFGDAPFAQPVHLGAGEPGQQS